jgi:hypothetical protein
MNKCEKPKCQYSITRKKCISPNPYIEKIAECGRNNIKIKECIKTYNKINDRKLSCDRMTDRLNYEKKLKIKAPKVLKGLKSLSMLPNKSKPSIQKYNYTALNKFINIPKDHNELKTITTNWILRNSDYVIQPLGGTKGKYDITSINDIMVAKLEDNNNITVGTNIYIKNMEKTGIFTETPDIYAICELYGVIINLFVWIPKTKTLNKISYIPWKYNTKKKVANVLSKNTILSMVLINNHYYSLEHNDIIDKYKPSNNIEKIINNALIKKYNMHLYNKVCYNNDNCFYNIIIRQLELLNIRIK